LQVVLDETMGVLPWFLPGIAVSMAIGLFACRAVGKLLGVRPLLAWTILVAFGVIVSATLTPLRGALDFAAIATGTCDLSRVGLAPIAQLIQLGDTSLNVALFIPLGIAIGLVPAFGPAGNADPGLNRPSVRDRNDPAPHPHPRSRLSERRYR